MSAQPHDERMTVDEFLAWPGHGDTRYELIEGYRAAQATPTDAHATLQAALARQLGNALEGRRSCRVMTEAGVRSSVRSNWNYRQPDLVVTCAPRTGPRFTPPQVIVEILSDSNERETRDKFFYYITLDSLQELVFIDSRRMEAEVFTRDADGHWRPDPAMAGSGQRLELPSLGIALDMDALYRDVL